MSMGSVRMSDISFAVDIELLGGTETVQGNIDVGVLRVQLHISDRSPTNPVQRVCGADLEMFRECPANTGEEENGDQIRNTLVRR
jgi:hypothetical protein